MEDHEDSSTRGTQCPWEGTALFEIGSIKTRKHKDEEASRKGSIKGVGGVTLEEQSIRMSIVGDEMSLEPIRIILEADQSLSCQIHLLTLRHKD